MLYRHHNNNHHWSPSQHTYKGWNSRCTPTEDGTPDAHLHVSFGLSTNNQPQGPDAVE